MSTHHLLSGSLGLALALHGSLASAEQLRGAPAPAARDGFIPAATAEPLTNTAARMAAGGHSKGHLRRLRLATLECDGQSVRAARRRDARR